VRGGGVVDRKVDKGKGRKCKGRVGMGGRYRRRSFENGKGEVLWEYKRDVREGS
jgi:hypothetical protein